MSRPAPRSMSVALEALTSRVAPRTPLGEIQAVWTDAAGEAVSGQAQPRAVRDGVVTVGCRTAVWAQELDLMAPGLVAALNERLGRDAVRALRCRVSGGDF